MKDAMHSSAKLIGSQRDVVVEYDWNDPESELILEEGAKITVMDAEDENYYRTTVDGISGYIPRNYVRV